MHQFITSVILIVVIIHVLLLGVAYLILLERKMASWIQDRIGPNRVGPVGLLQPIADGIKFLLKEEFTPPFVDRTLFRLAPLLVIVPALLGWAVIPWGGYFQSDGFSFPSWLPFAGGIATGAFTVNITAVPISIGLIYILAIGSLAVYGVVIGGYASNNKYSFLGGLRATAQMLSYEIPMGLCVLMIILMHGSANASDLVHLQANGVWDIFYQPLVAIIFFTTILAETNRAPFDLAECEQELVGGYHTEYSSMKFALFFLGEYLHMVTGAAFFVVLFLGGWDLPGLREPVAGGLGWVILKTAVFLLKVAALLALMIWIRWTLPRLRFDQLMKMAWRGLIPITLVLLIVEAALVFAGTNLWWMLIANAAVLVGAALVSPLLPPGPPVNRRVPLAGSRFSVSDAT